MEKKLNRLGYIDFGKGIAILCVVMGHLMYSDDMKSFANFLYSFHIPFFFFLSGIVLSLSGNFGFKKFCLRSLSLLLPFCLWGGVICIVFSKNMFSEYWFLPVLWLYTAGYYGFLFLGRHKKMASYFFMAAALLFMALTCIYTRNSIVYKVCYFSLSYVIPFVLGTVFLQIKSIIPKYNFLYLLFFAIAYFFFDGFNVELKNQLLKNVTGVCASLLLVQLCEKSNPDNRVVSLVSYVGRHTLIIYLVHYFFLEHIALSASLLAFCVYAMLAIIIVLFCLGIEKVMRLSEIMSFIALGKIPKKMNGCMT